MTLHASVLLSALLLSGGAVESTEVNPHYWPIVAQSGAPDYARIAEMIPALLAQLDDPQEEMRLRAASTLAVGALGDLSIESALYARADILVRHLNDPSAGVREHLLLVILMLHPAPPVAVIDPLIELLGRDPSTNVRANAIDVFLRMRSAEPRVVRAILRALRSDNSAAVRGQCARYFEEVPASAEFAGQVMAALVALLQTTPLDLQMDNRGLLVISIESLAAFGAAAREALPVLEKLARDSSSAESMYVAEAAQRAIGQVSGMPWQRPARQP